MAKLSLHENQHLGHGPFHVTCTETTVLCCPFMCKQRQQEGIMTVSCTTAVVELSSTHVAKNRMVIQS